MTIFPAVGVQVILAEFAGEAFGHLPLERLLAQILIAFLGFAVEALLLVEQVRCAEPHIAQAVDVKLPLCLALLDEDVPLAARTADVDVTDACILEQLLDFRAVLVGDLYHDARVLSKEHLHKVVALYLVQVDFESALCVREAHLQEARDETACRDVVTGEDEAALYQVLNGVEGIAEVLRIAYRRHIAPDFPHALGKGGAAESQLVEREVYMI